MPAPSRTRPGRQSAADVSVDAREFVDLFGKLSKVEPRLKAQLRRRMRAAAMVAVHEMQSEVQSGGTGRRRVTVTRTRRGQAVTERTNVRSAIARGIKVTMPAGARAGRVGVYIQATASALPAARKAMVRLYNKPRWRHPVFGNRNDWVTQSGHPYFDTVIDRQKAAIEEAIREAMADALSSIQ